MEYKLYKEGELIGSFNPIKLFKKLSKYRRIISTPGGTRVSVFDSRLERMTIEIEDENRSRRVRAMDFLKIYLKDNI